MSTIIEDLGDYLASNGFGIVGDSIVLNKMPDSPDNLVSITMIGGYAQPIPINDARPAFNIQVRDVSHLVALNKINAIYNVFDNDSKRSIEILDSVTSAVIRKIIFRKMQPPIFLKEDAGGRAYYSMSVDVWTRRD